MFSLHCSKEILYIEHKCLSFHMFNGGSYCLFTLDSQSRPLSQSSHAQKTMSCEHFSDPDFTFCMHTRSLKKTCCQFFGDKSLYFCYGEDEFEGLFVRFVLICFFCQDQGDF